MSENIKILSFNVRGINDQEKRLDVFDYLKNLNCDICCIQDVHCPEDQQNKFKRDWGGELILSCGKSNSRGAAILLRDTFEYKILDVKKDKCGNYIILTLNFFNMDICIVNIYGPNTDNPDFYQEIFEQIIELNTSSVILCGDWNLVQNQQLDTKYYHRNNNIRARNCVLQFKSQLELEDPWRTLYPERSGFTWFQRNPIKMARLDFFLISTDIMNLLSSCLILAGYRSDHSIVKIELCASEEKRGKGFWKFNSSLLKDPTYEILVKNVVRECIMQYACEDEDITNPNLKLNISDQLFFETLKMELRKNTIIHSAKKKREEQNDENKIRHLIAGLEHKNLNDQSKLDELTVLNNQLESIRKNKIKGMILRSKIQWAEESEKPTRFFANLEKKNYISKLVTKVNKNGKIVTNQESILYEIENFYKNLYSSKLKEKSTEGVNRFLNINNVKQLTDEDALLCEGNIRKEEIESVLHKMKTGKSPGIDGFPVEFYIHFWKILGNFLYRSLKQAFVKGELSITQKRGIITTLPKGNKPREFLKNWRPISLLSSDYKILTAVLSARLKKVLPSIVSPNQRGFLKGRYMEENTRFVYDLIQFCKEKKRDGLLLLIDFEKAFDSLEWDFIRDTLKSYNFGPNFIKWFNIIYKDCQSCVTNNGHYSSFFNLHRGCRQGDPLSPYIFILAIEPLAQCILNSRDIEGIKIGSNEFKIGQYADDTFLTIDNNFSTLESVLNIILSNVLKKFQV